MTVTPAPEQTPVGVPEDMPRVSPGWLGLRESADGAARAAELVGLVRTRLAGAGHVVIHDLGCGTGSMGRWLAPQLPGPQHWILYDRDADLLAHAAAGLSAQSADGAPVTVQTRQFDLGRLTADDLDGASLVTASALLDLLTVEEVQRIAKACVGAGAPALLTLSVAGRVDLVPADPLDAQISAAFNAHQRRVAEAGQLLGPDAVAATVAAFAGRGAVSAVRASPWRLGRDDGELIAQWFAGWVGAACEQRPDLAGPVAEYSRRRLAEAAQGRLDVVVHHRDVLAGWE